MKSLTLIFCSLLTMPLLIAPAIARDRYGDYDGRHGYRERPYDHGRHYGHYDHRGRKYDYRGHWRSWDEWDHYAREHPEIYRHGRYYHDGAHLMFRFCEPDDSACVFFSIGR